MSEHYDPQGWYDVIEPEGQKTGELRAGVYYEEGNVLGRVENGIFTYDILPNGGKGHIDGLTLIRTEPRPMTRFALVLQEGQPA
ncbi:hypothetical protein [Pseudomonas fluorescens]|uniref:Uncharacterized protein n=1 Tax=Pseudomonas fluorescens TaxID=294 RepID=A0A423MEU1_PSEFL|nr:hypothetical protein [Pseudomonas fluorescens]RON81590.1 hypothetical protein BK670_15595 [Pseudomonas fluorescens]